MKELKESGEYCAIFKEVMSVETYNGDDEGSTIFEATYNHIRYFDTLKEAKEFNAQVHLWDFNDSGCDDVYNSMEIGERVVYHFYRPRFCCRIESKKKFSKMLLVHRLTSYEYNERKCYG